MNIRRALTFSILMLFFANGLSVLCINFLAQIGISPEYLTIRDQIDAQVWISVLAQGGPFPVVTLLVWLYYFPVFKESRKVSPENFKPATKRKVLRSPLTLSLLGMFGWTLGTVFFLGLAPLAGIYPPFGLVLENIIVSFVLAAITFVVTYYGAEFILRQYMMVAMFPDGEIEQQEEAFRISIRGRLFIFLFSCK